MAGEDAVPALDFSAEARCALCRNRATGVAHIGDSRYCHGDFDRSPTCYEKAIAARDHGLSITCPICKATSYHIMDVAFGYCGHCHLFTGDRA